MKLFHQTSIETLEEIYDKDFPVDRISLLMLQKRFTLLSSGHSFSMDFYWTIVTKVAFVSTEVFSFFD